MNRRHAAVPLPMRASASVAIAGTTARVEIRRFHESQTDIARHACPAGHKSRNLGGCTARVLLPGTRQRVALAMTRHPADASPPCRDEPRRARKGMASAQSAVLPPCLFPA
jgi:hypothetical protein